MPAKLWLVKLWKFHIYHYCHRLYQISSVAANLSLEDLKQLCREKSPSQVYLLTPKLIIKPDSMIKKFQIYIHIP